ncbi:MAG TPA: pyridoxamine 5'-phosphate oxidase [Vicinamibacteria bacterium]|nr:pyridoxamine 5'-phosphate oxidase [Vicinamibacteria bacterium]
MARFEDLFLRAKETEADATAAALGTADATGAPSVRMVLLKDVDGSGFVFFTNYESRKARELEVNPRAALCFHWRTVGAQVRVEGQVERLGAAESDAYFATRPRDSQLGAWASEQSAPLRSRAELMLRVAAAVARFAGRDVPRPETWGGYRLRPERIEFWTEHAFRLHDRELYTRVGEGWDAERLFP